jgi:hypothetical protein
MFLKEVAHEYRDGRRDQALDGAPEVGFGFGHHSREDHRKRVVPSVRSSASEIESWIDQAKAGMENAPNPKPEDIREQYETQRKALQEAYGEAILELGTRKKWEALLAKKDET